MGLIVNLHLEQMLTEWWWGGRMLRFSNYVFPEKMSSAMAVVYVRNALDHVGFRTAIFMVKLLLVVRLKHLKQPSSSKCLETSNRSFNRFPLTNVFGPYSFFNRF